MELIVTEKDNAARRIAEILSGDHLETSRQNGVTVYEWAGTRCIGLSGHVVGIDFPPEYAEWRDVEPVELVDADIETVPTQEEIVGALRVLARRADGVTIATDYDREGELIGKEAHEIVREVNETVPIRRVRFSSITEGEVRTAFESPEDLDFALAEAGEARQIIDLLWGASLTRFLSLSSGQLGQDFISVGRVQSPTLRLIVDREREIEAFEPETYWELFADLETDAGEDFRAQYFYLDEDETETDRIWEEATAVAAHEALETAASVTVAEVDRRTRTDRPPAPFNTTQFIRAAGAIGYSANRAMSIAEDLYTAGYITYPRTDNTVYPDDLEPTSLLECFVGHHTLGESAESLLEADAIEPTAGDEETTDHPPIHPTGELPAKRDLSEDEWSVYELVVRRFFATVADPAEWEHLRVVAETGAHRLKANGKRLLEPGYHAVYPYFSTTENYVPDVEAGEALAVAGTDLLEKETQPPRRYGQSRLIELMESMGIGTKATRHGTIQKLYDRGYIEEDPPRPTRLARAVVAAAEQFADPIVSEEMTAQLEEDMDAIAAGEADLEAVTAASREMLRDIFDRLTDSREEIGEHLRSSLKEDRRLGPCPECEADLLLRRSRYGSHFVGCDGYPDCEYTLPLPSDGEPQLLEDRCEDHGLRSVKILAGRGTFVHGCPRCAAEEAGEGPAVGDCPDCGSGSLTVKTLRTGSRLVGCDRYPDCEYSLPLPRRGEIEAREARCEDHDLLELVVHDGDEPWELGCPICNYEEYRERQEAGSDLERLEGIGERTAAKLAEAGIESVDDLSEADPAEVAASVDGVSADRVRSWQAKA